MIGHVPIHFTGKLDEARVKVEFLRFPGKIERVDRNAVTAEPGARVKRLEAKRLGRGGTDHFEDINPHAKTQQLELIYQRYVHAAVNVF